MTDQFETLAVHAGGEADPATGAVTPPIHLSTTFAHSPEGKPVGDHIYIRFGNPTQDRLEVALAALEGAEGALVFASGMAAGAAFLQSLPAGAQVLFHDDIYYTFRQLVGAFFERWGLLASFVDMSNLDLTRRALTTETRLLWLETPSNPLLKISDIETLAEIAHSAGASLLVDGTFASPALQRPLSLGADIVLHSATKYLGGHSDVLGGALALRQSGEAFERLRSIRTLTGAALSPFNAWLVLRGIRSLSPRMERHAANAQAVAEALVDHPALEAVYYPGLPSHPGHAIAMRQMRAGGGIVSIILRGGAEAALRTASRLRLFTNATSLGGVESLVEHRASIEGPASRTPPGLLRLSIGLEHPSDLIADLLQGLS